MVHFDTLITKGVVFDGRRNPRLVGDVGILDGRIAQVGSLANATADRVIDARGLHVAPGIIDLHTHYDSQLFWDPYCSTSGWHGVTTVMIGNCGFGFAPCRPDERGRAMLAMSRNEAVPLVCMEQGMPWDWVTFPEFLASLQRTDKAVNVLPLVPLNPLMAWVMGYERAKAGVVPTDDEHREMVRLLHEALDAGAKGISAQRMGPASVQRDFDGTPMITDVMHDETMLLLAGALGERNEGIIQYTYIDIAAMQRGDVDVVNDVVRPHIEEVARISRRPVILQAAGDSDIEWVGTAQAQGLRIYALYITTSLSKTPVIASYAESASSFDFVVSWNQATVGTLEEVKAKLADPTHRAAMRAEAPIMEATFGNMADWVLARAATPAYSKFDQTPLGHVAKELGYDDVMDAFCDINIAEDLKTRWYRETGGSEEDPASDGLNAVPRGLQPYKNIALDPYAMPGISDGGAHTKYVTAGNYGTHFLMEYVRKHSWTTLEDAHYKLSALPAFAAGLRDRGVIEVGAAADIMIYDYDALGITEREEAFDYPAGEWRLVDKPIGLRYVLVNGRVTLEDNDPTQAYSGQLV